MYLRQIACTPRNPLFMAYPPQTQVWQQVYTISLDTWQNISIGETWQYKQL